MESSRPRAEEAHPSESESSVIAGDRAVNPHCRLAVGTRTSPLAMSQTEEVLSLLRARFPAAEFVAVPISTRGDREKDAPLVSLGRGSFTKEIERALLRGEIDLAVHSAKDMAALPEGLTLAAVGRRIDPRDVLVNRWGRPLTELPTGSRIGTGSPRRAALLKALRPDLEVPSIRGNVGTRLDKVKRGEYDGVVIAAAGLLRLGRVNEVSEFLSPESFTPEVGQGVLAVQAREGDSSTIEMLAAVDHGPSNTALRAERAFVEALGGGCRVPVTAYARVDGGRLGVLAVALRLDGKRVFRTRVSGDACDPEATGRAAADSLLNSGASEIVGKG